MLRVVMFVVALGHVALGSDPLVSTPLGDIRGQILQSRGKKDFFSFTRIPYAEPPVGANRFMVATEARNWTGILNATQPSPNCVQPMLIGNVGQEDCLYLNIFTPNLTKKSLPVIFSIHGGAFQVGSAAGDFGFARYYMDEDVVFAAPNYRLGALGFLSLEDSNIPGNMGLKDQLLALNWVRKYISYFGGDPDNIIVIGESAGGVSSNFICSVPVANSFIKGCISQSGVGSSPWAITKRGLARETALNIAKAVGCPLDKEKDLIKCLQSTPVEKISNTSSSMVNINKGDLLLTPVLEPEGTPGAVVTRWPPQATYRKFPWITGVCQDEGMLMTALYEYHVMDQNKTDQFINGFNQTVISEYHLEKRPADFQRIHDRFFKNNLEPLRAIRNYFTEVMFLYPTLKSLSEHKGPTYFYRFNYTRGPHTVYNRNVTGVPHASEMPYFYEAVSNNPDWPNAQDIALSKQLVKMWSNFARHKNPSSQETIQWPQFQGQYYLDIQDAGVSIRNWTEYKETLDFWKSIIPESSSSSTIQSSMLVIAAITVFTILKTIF